jgi:hypothetical protein
MSWWKNYCKFSVGKITKYWLILFKIEGKQIILFVPMTGKKLINGNILKNNKISNFSISYRYIEPQPSC